MSFATTRPSLGAAYDPSVALKDRQAMLAEGFDCILTGRPLPDYLRPAPLRASMKPGSCDEGIARILRGPGA